MTIKKSLTNFQRETLRVAADLHVSIEGIKSELRRAFQPEQRNHWGNSHKTNSPPKKSFLFWILSSSFVDIHTHSSMVIYCKPTHTHKKEEVEAIVLCVVSSKLHTRVWWRALV